MRRAPAAAVIALLLFVAAGLAPAALPAAPLPAALVPPVALAADDIDIATTARYTVVPAKARVRVVVDITARNDKPDAAVGGEIKRFYYDGVNLGVQPEARSIRATQDGSAANVRAVNAGGYRLVTVSFLRKLYYGQTTRLRLTFDLPGGAPRSASDIRVGPAFATFTVWAFGDRGTVRVEVPDGFDVVIAGEDMAPASGRDGLQAWTASSAEPLDWYAFVDATNDSALTRDRLDLPGGEELVVRGWPDDKRWRSRVRSLLRDGVPALVQRIGLAWPVQGPLTVTEVHTPLLEGYGGFYDPRTDRITISEDLDDLTIVHEASHAWFNKALFAERWITEGLADEYAARVLRALGRGYPSPDAVSGTEDVAFALSDWPPPSPIKDRQSRAREQYGYDASWTVMRRIVELIGEDGMRRVFAAASAGTMAYAGEGSSEKSSMPSDWRRFLDLAQAQKDLAGVADLIAQFALSAKEKLLLPARAAARQAYGDLAKAGATWAPPLVVRRLLDGWDFARAADAMHQATGVLGSRDAIGTLAAHEGLTLDPGLEGDYEDAGSTSELQVVEDDAARSLRVLREIAAASDDAGATRDWLTDLGLDGVDPAAGARAAGSAWEHGDLPAAESAALGVVARLQAAPSAGRTRALAIGGGASAAIVLLVALVAFVVVRRRGAAARRALAVAGATMPSRSLRYAAPSAAIHPEVPAAAPDDPWPPAWWDHGAAGIDATPGTAPAQPGDRPPPPPPPPPVAGGSWMAGPPAGSPVPDPGGVPPDSGIVTGSPGRVPHVPDSAPGTAERAGPYATLPPDGSPPEPPGAPTSGDQGADRS